jgi:hypothetical protein
MKNRRFVFGALTLSIFFLCSAGNVYREIWGPPSSLAYTPQLTQVAASTLTISSGRSVVVTSASDGGSGSLRQALIDTQSGDTITFDPNIFSPSAPATIYLTSSLSGINQNNIFVDASNAGVILDGGKIIEQEAYGLHILSNGNKIQGLQFANFSTGTGIILSGGAKNNTIGGDRSIGSGPHGQGNLFRNGLRGIWIWGNETSFNTVKGNLIGTDAAGSNSLGNEYNGIVVSEGASRNIIGPDNIIAYNGQGMAVRDAHTMGNTITQNSIHDNNNGIGIYLAQGANNELVAPILLDFNLASGAVIGSTIGNCIVEIFSDSKGEGMIYEGQTTADQNGFFNFSKGAPFIGPNLTALATDSNGNTSEFSEPTSGTRRSIILQDWNNRPITRLKYQPSSELLDNRIGEMLSIIDSSHIDESAESFVEKINKQSFKWLRLSLDKFDWNDIKDTGEYSRYTVSSKQDEVINLLNHNNIKIMCTLVYWDESLKIDSSDYSRYTTEEEIRRYLNYIEFVVNHFKGRIQYYEILNEPNLGEGTQQYVEVKSYINLAKRAISVIRQVDPNAKIVVGAVSPLYEAESYEYFFTILRSDLMPLVDAISWHSGNDFSPEYTSEFFSEYPSLLQEIHDIASSHGFKGEYFVEELHWRTIDTSHPVETATYSEVVVAKYLARGIVMHQSRDVATGVAMPIFEQSYNEAVIKNLGTLLAGAKPSNHSIEVKSTVTNVKSVSFSLPNRDTLVALWTDGIAVDEDPGFMANLTIRSFTAEDVIGIDLLNSVEQPLLMSSGNGDVSVQNLIVRDYPLILRLSPVAKPPIITDLTITPTEVKTKQPIEINVIVTNTEGRERNYTIPLAINGSEEDTETFTLGGGQNGTLVFRLMKDSAGSYLVKVGNLTGVFTVIAPRPAVILLSYLQITKATVKPGEEVEITAKLENVGELPGNYTIIFTLDGVEKGSFPITLDGGATITKTLKISSDVVGVHQISVGGQSVTFEVEKVQTGISSYPIESVLIGVMLVVIILIHRTRVR